MNRSTNTWEFTDMCYKIQGSQKNDLEFVLYVYILVAPSMLR